VKINQNARNIGIVLVLAVAVDAVKGGQTVATVVLQAISLAFLAVIAWIASRLYREHRTTIYSLGTRRRTIVYVAAGVVTLLFTASDRMLDTAAGTVAWIAILVAAVYAVYAVFRSARQY